MVETRLNPVLASLPEAGQLCEITVPYAQAYRYNRLDGWQSHYRLPIKDGSGRDRRGMAPAY